MFKHNLFLILTCICARASRIQIPIEVNITPEVFDEEIAPENVVEKAAEAAEGLLEALEEETVGGQNDCSGGLLDFIQCAVREKIDSFRKEFSKVAFPEIPPGAFQRHTLDSNIQGSLEKWLQELNKHINIKDVNCTGDN